LGQQTRDAQQIRQAQEQAQFQQKLMKVTADKAAYASEIVSRWEDAAKASGRWDPNFSTELQGALMQLTPESLLALGGATTFEGMMSMLATGQSKKTAANPTTPLPDALGNFAADLVFTPVPICRIVDTRNVGGHFAGGTTRSYDVDGSTFTAQGGVNASCGIPFGVASAVVMVIRAITPASTGYFKAWSVGQPQPVSSVLNYTAGPTILNTAIVPVLPGGGNDFSVFSSAASELAIDVVGYFAAPAATALDCITVSSAATAIPVNAWTPVDAVCPVGRTATGGGYNTPEGTLGYPGVWVTSLPNGNGWRVWVDNQTDGPRTITSYASCCRVPGR
jgi:hypothetical protein